MSNAYINEHDQLISLTANQQNPGAAKPTDFKIEDRDGGHTGDTKAERAALLARVRCVRSNQIEYRLRIPIRKDSIKTWSILSSYPKPDV
jgi:hypothetical protein